MHWLNRYRLLRVFNRPVAAKSSPKRPSKLQVETLERRDVPATFSVTSLAPILENGGSQQAFMITLDGAQSSGVYTVDYVTADGTAHSMADYGYESTSVTLDASNTSATVYITTIDNAVNEADKSFVLILSNARGIEWGYDSGSGGSGSSGSGDYSFSATVGIGSNGAALTIVDDDLPNAVADSYDTDHYSGTFLFNVLDNDLNLGPSGYTITGVTAPGGGTATIEGNAIRFAPAYGFAGATDFSYTVTDIFGGTSSATVSVTVENNPPVAVDDLTFHVTANSSVAGNVLGNDVDPDGDSLSAEELSYPSQGSLTFNPDGSFVYTPNFGAHGGDSFTYEAYDDYGGSSTATVYLYVDNSAPVAKPYEVYIHAGNVVNISPDLTTDPDGDSVTVTGVGDNADGAPTYDAGSITFTPNPTFYGDTAFSYTLTDSYGASAIGTVLIHFENQSPTPEGFTLTAHAGSTVIIMSDMYTFAVNPYVDDPDGDPVTLSGVGGASQGTATSSAGAITYTPNQPGFIGSDSFSYTLMDPFGATGSGTITIDYTDAAPTATDQTYTVSHDKTLNFDALAGSNDPDGDPLTVTVTNGPSHGNLDRNPDGTFLYTPNAGYIGGDSIGIMLTDPFGMSCAVTEIINVVNNPPVAVDDGTYSVWENTPYSGNVLTNDVDPDGDAMTAVELSGPTQGSLTLNSNGTFVYTPNENAHGADSFTYTVSDGISSSTGTVSINIVDAPLTSGSGASIEHIVEGTEFDAQVAMFGDTDPLASMRGSLYTASIDWGDGTTSDGTLSGYTVSGTHVYEDEGSYTVQVTIYDVDGATVTVNGTATIDDAPLVAEKATGTGSRFTGVVGTEIGASLASFSFTDSETNASDLEVSLNWGDGSSSGAEVDGGGGSFTVHGTHTYADPGSYLVTVSATDPATGLSKVTHTTATISPAALSDDPVASLTATAGTALTDPSVAAFSDANTSDEAGKFSATVDWGDGGTADGVIASTGSGTFSVSVEGEHIYEIPGHYKIHTRIHGPGSLTVNSYTDVEVSSLLGGSLNLTTTPFSGSETEAVSATLATFSGSANQDLHGFVGLVDWGDGSGWQHATIAGSGGSFTVSGTHAYARFGDYAVIVEVQDGTRSQLRGTTAKITELAPTVTADDLVLPTVQTLTNIVVGSVVLPAGFTINDYDAEIHWGDGASSVGTLVQAGDQILVIGSYTYGFDSSADAETTGLLTLQIGLTRVGGSTTTGSAAVRTTAWTEGEKVPTGLHLAHFRDDRADADPEGAGGFSGTIHWYDESGTMQSSSGLVDGSGNRFGVASEGDVAFGEAGTDTIAVDIEEGDHPAEDPQLTVSNDYLVADAPLAAGSAPALTGTAGVNLAAGTLTLTSFTDSDPAARYADGSQYSALVDWGDGTHQYATIVAATTNAADPDGPYSFKVKIEGSMTHSYAKAGNYKVNVIVRDEDGASLVILGAAAIAPAIAPAAPAFTVAAATAVRSNDPTRADRTSFGDATVALNTGGLMVGEALDFDLSPGASVGGNPMLAYNSNTVGRGTVVEAVVSVGALPTGASVSSIAAQLTWSGGTAQTPIAFTVISAASQYTIQVPNTDTAEATWGYGYSLDVTVTLSNGQSQTVTITGEAPVIAQKVNQFGEGWNLSETSRIVVDAGTATRVLGTGESTVFSGNPKDGYARPANDFGTLTVSGGQFVYQDVHKNVWTYSGDGQLLSTVDRDGVTTSYTYNGGLLTQISAPDGGVTTFTSSNDRTSEIAEPGSSRTVGLTFSSGGDLLVINDAEDYNRTFAYSGHLLGEDVWGPRDASYGYNTGGAVSSINLGGGVTLAIKSASTAGLVAGTALTTAPASRTTTAGGKITTDTLDLLGRLLKKTYPDTISESWTLNDAGDAVTYTDRKGLTTSYTYDDLGGIIRTDYPDDTYTTASYGSHHMLASSKDADGNTTTYDISSTTGDTLSMIDPLGTTTYTWTDGLLMSVTDADDNETDYTYDSHRRLIEVAPQEGDDTFTNYDANGNVFETWDLNYDTTTTVYDKLNRLISITDANEKTTTYDYNAPGDQVQEIDPNSDEIDTPVDGRGLPTGSIDGAELTSAQQRVTTETNNTDEEPTLTIDPMGRATQTVYNIDGMPVVVTSGQWNSTTGAFTEGVRVTYYQYDDDFNTTLTVEGDGTLANNRATRDDYNTGGDVYKRTEGAWVWTSLPTATSAGAGSFTESHSSYFQYDKSGDVTLSVDPMGRATQTVYNGVHLPTSVTEGKWTWASPPTATSAGTGAFISTTAHPVRTTYAGYDAAGRTVSTTDANGETIHDVYDGDGRRVLVVDPDLHASKTVYNPEGLESASIRGVAVYNSTTGWSLDTTQPYRVTQFFYDAGNLVRQIEPDGATTVTVYNAMNEVAAVIGRVELDTTGASVEYMLAHPLGHVWTVTSYAYNVFGDETGRTDARGKSTAWTFDKDSEVDSTTGPLGRVDRFAYNAFGKKTGETGDAELASALWETVSSVIDAFGETTRTTDAMNNLVSTAYNAFGFATSQTDARNKTTTYTYNDDGQVLTATDARGHITENVYDDFGNMTLQTTDAGTTSAQTTHYTYDADNRLLTTTAPIGVTTREYDDDGNLVSFEDPDHNVTTYEYNFENQLVLKTSTLGDTTTTYDGEGRVYTVTDALGRKKINTYDDLNRLTVQVWKNASGTTVDTLTYTYDAVGNLLTASKGSGGYTFTYYDDNRVHTALDPNGVTLTYGYDDNGNVTQLSDSLGGTVVSTYDLDNRLKTRKVNGSGVTNALSLGFTYNANSQLATITRYADGSFGTVIGTTTFGYDDVGNRTGEVHKNASGATLVGYTDAFDGFDRISSEARTDSLGTVTTPYTYDANSEVTGDGSRSYTYDPNGNRTMTGYTRGTNNEITSDGTWNYAYDAVGNLTSKTRISDNRYWTYGYDLRNQMTQAVEYDHITGSVLRTADYTYDVFGNMLSRTMTPATGPAETARFAYDLTSHGSGTTENANGLWAELDGSDALQTRYLNGQGGEHLARTGPTNSTAYFLTDRLGSVRELVDLGGAVVNSVSYDAFGNIVSESGSVDLGNVRFADYWYDGATGLYSTHWRWYNPENAQWTTEDPKGIDAGDGNFRRYVGNNGANAVDPSGLELLIFDPAPGIPAFNCEDTKEYKDKLIGSKKDSKDNLIEIHCDGTQFYGKIIIAGKSPVIIPFGICLYEDGINQWYVDYNEDRSFKSVLQVNMSPVEMDKKAADYLKKKQELMKDTVPRHILPPIKENAKLGSVAGAKDNSTTMDLNLISQQLASPISVSEPPYHPISYLQRADMVRKFTKNDKPITDVENGTVPYHAVAYIFQFDTQVVKVNRLIDLTPGVIKPFDTKKSDMGEFYDWSKPHPKSLAWYHDKNMDGGLSK